MSVSISYIIIVFKYPPGGRTVVTRWQNSVSNIKEVLACADSNNQLCTGQAKMQVAGFT